MSRPDSNGEVFRGVSSWECGKRLRRSPTWLGEKMHTDDRKDLLMRALKEWLTGPRTDIIVSDVIVDGQGVGQSPHAGAHLRTHY
jgi:hypothetical protein